MHSFAYSSLFRNEIWDRSRLKQFACRFSALRNQTIEYEIGEFQSVKNYFQTSLPANRLPLFICLVITEKQVSVCLDFTFSLVIVLGNTLF